MWEYYITELETGKETKLQREPTIELCMKDGAK